MEGNGVIFRTAAPTIAPTPSLPGAKPTTSLDESRPQSLEAIVSGLRKFLIPEEQAKEIQAQKEQMFLNQIDSLSGVIESLKERIMQNVVNK